MLAGGVSSAGAGETDAPSAGYLLETWYAGQGTALRVNSPDVRDGPFKDRWEAKKDGVLRLTPPMNPARAQAAELYMELWGGHPGVANKRFVANGRTTYTLPETGAANHHCTYSYPTIPLKLADLRAGENEFAFQCDRGEAFWGHYFVRAACWKLLLSPDAPVLSEHGLTGARPRIEVQAPAGGEERIHARLIVPAGLAGRVARVDWFGHYAGFDENGQGGSPDWHGYTRDSQPVAHLGSDDEAPFELAWDVSMVPDQETVRLRAEVRWSDPNHLVYRTGPTAPIAMPSRSARVSLLRARDIPRPFWSRADQVRECVIPVDIDPARMEKVQLHVVIWDGGKGTTAKPFTLNGQALPVPVDGSHHVFYRVLDVDPAILRRGENRCRLVSNTRHHGIEILRPGPALIIRTKPAH